jgi:hypothetical protein
MQWLLIKHGILPSTFYGLSEGEKVMVYALFEDWIENREKG